MIVIRIAEAKDAEMIADLSRQTFHDSFAEFNTAENMQKFFDQQFTRTELIREVTAPGNVFLLAYHDDTIAGYVRMREHNNPPELKNDNAMELARIYAIQTSIGKGVGSQLMQTCLDVAKQRGRDTIWLGVWEHNQRAIDFYKKWGFEKFSEHDFILGDDVQTDWLMKRKL